MCISTSIIVIDEEERQRRSMSSTNYRGQEMNSDESMKEEIIRHPLFNDLLAAHDACSRVATTALMDDFPAVTLPLSTNRNEELDYFMASYIAMLRSLAENLQPCIMEATMALKSIEQDFFELSGTFATDVASGSSIPIGTEKSLAEMMKQDVKLKLQEDYEVKIKHLWEGILSKRPMHKSPLPNGISSVLMKWWDDHLHWPYPTCEEKEMLMRETGMEKKQLNKWFINQRNRYWDC